MGVWIIGNKQNKKGRKKKCIFPCLRSLLFMAFIFFSICSLLRRKQPHLSSVNLRTECPGEPASEYHSYWLILITCCEAPARPPSKHCSSLDQVWTCFPPQRGYLLSTTLGGTKSHGKLEGAYTVSNYYYQTTHLWSTQQPHQCPDCGEPCVYFPGLMCDLTHWLPQKQLLQTLRKAEARLTERLFSSSSLGHFY